MPGRIGVNLEVVLGVGVGRIQYLCPERHDSVVSRREILDPQIEVHLLWRPVRPIRRNVIGRELNPDPRFAVDAHHVPVIFRIHGTLEHPGPEAALGSEIRGVEDDDLTINTHSVILASPACASVLLLGTNHRVAPRAGARDQFWPSDMQRRPTPFRSADNAPNPYTHSGRRSPGGYPHAEGRLLRLRPMLRRMIG
jgi:hypothetical protein